MKTKKKRKGDIRFTITDEEKKELMKFSAEQKLKPSAFVKYATWKLIKELKNKDSV